MSLIYTQLGTNFPKNKECPLQHSIHSANKGPALFSKISVPSQGLKASHKALSHYAFFALLASFPGGVFPNFSILLQWMVIIQYNLLGLSSVWIFSSSVRIYYCIFVTQDYLFIKASFPFILYLQYQSYTNQSASYQYKAS